LPLGLRLACLSVGVPVVVGLPVGDATVLFVLVLALDLALATLVLSRLASHLAAPGVAPVWLNLGADPDNLHLLRRTVPQLRGRRPQGVIAAQVRWRQKAEIRRSRDAVS
jgi:hypothetical protein